LALHDAPVSAEDPPAVSVQSRPFSAEMAEQASAMGELVRLVMSRASLSPAVQNAHADAVPRRRIAVLNDTLEHRFHRRDPSFRDATAMKKSP
jgi:hypothetical protein